MFKSRAILWIFIIFAVSSIATSVYNLFIVYPSYSKLLIRNTEEEAVRIGSHLSTMLKDQLHHLAEGIVPPDIATIVQELQYDFKFTKIKLFSQKGTIVFSTDKSDIGEVNGNSYFQDIIAEGKSITKVVEMGSVSLDGERAAGDVVETYVPIKSGGKIVGAFEIYYDITLRKEALDQVIRRSSLAPVLGPVVSLGILLFLMIRLDMGIAKQKETEKELIHYSRRLQISNRELEDFAHIASHDLQEPLRKVVAFGDRLKSKYAGMLDETGRDYIERMLNATRRMQSLINGLLSFSRITTQGQPFVAVDLTKLTHEVVSDLEVRIEQTRAKVEVDELAVIDADPLQMRQLMQNLVGNALKFIKDDMPPIVKISGRHIFKDDHDKKKHDLDKSYYQFSVDDNGIGFDQKYEGRIFGVFQRLHGRMEYEGTGIGLSICRRIVERHNGRITAKGRPGEGASFEVTLPVKQQIQDRRKR